MFTDRTASLCGLGLDDGPTRSNFQETRSRHYFRCDHPEVGKRLYERVRRPSSAASRLLCVERSAYRYDGEHASNNATQKTPVGACVQRIRIPEQDISR